MLACGNHKNIKYSEAGLLALHSKVLIIKKSTFYIGLNKTQTLIAYPMYNQTYMKYKEQENLNFLEKNQSTDSNTGMTQMLK